MTAKTHTIPKDCSALALDPSLPPVLEVDPGETVVFETGDERYERLHRGETLSEIGLGHMNAVTGPLAVRGAEPGDALRIEILEVEIRRAWAVWLPGFGAFRTERLQIRETPVEGDRLRIGPNLTVPLEPMIGCMGLAPSTGTSSTYEPAYPWGGNLDLKELSPGTSVLLPVQLPGASLFVGDLHAAMGAGEPAWVGLEAAGSARLRIGLEKNKAIPAPRLRIGTETVFVGLGENREEAWKSALDQAFSYLTTDLCLEPFEAFAYASARVGLRPGGPASSMILAVVPDP